MSHEIRALNDAFRTTMTGGRVVMTAGVDALASDVKVMAIGKVASFTKFTPNNDPHGEHDFGSFELGSRTFFWKIDCWPCTNRPRAYPKVTASLQKLE